MSGATHPSSGCVRLCWSLLVHKDAAAKRSTEKYEALLCSIMDSQQYLSDAEIYDGLRYIATELGLLLTEPVATQIVQILREESDSSNACGHDWSSRDSTLPGSAANPLLMLTRDGINKMKVGELRDYLVGAGLDPDGLKKALVDRLVAARDAALAQSLSSSQTSCGVSGTRESESRHKFSTILVLDHNVQEFPWEGLDIMKVCDSVTRMPSLDLVLQTVGQVQRRSGTDTPGYPVIRRERTSFVLNAAGDLQATQKHLGPVLERGRSRFGWQGIVGRAPELEEMRCVHTHCVVHPSLFSSVDMLCVHSSLERIYWSPMCLFTAATDLVRSTSIVTESSSSSVDAVLRCSLDAAAVVWSAKACSVLMAPFSLTCALEAQPSSPCYGMSPIKTLTS